jgi:hypothetical protein
MDRWFPDGALVQVVQDVPEEEDSPTYVCPRIMVKDSELDHPLLLLIDPEVKSSYARLNYVEDYGTTPDRTELLFYTDAGLYHISSYLTPEAKAQAQRYREAAPDVYEPGR